MVKSFYLRRDLLERFEAEHRRLTDKDGPTAKGHLLEAVVAAGLAELEGGIPWEGGGLAEMTLLQRDT